MQYSFSEDLMCNIKIKTGIYKRSESCVKSFVRNSATYPINATTQLVLIVADKI